MRSNKSALTGSTRHPGKRKKLEWTDWLHKALLTFKPPERLSVSEWADKHRELDSKTAAEPGKWKTSKTPYLEEIMNAWIDPDIEEIIFCKPTQVGGTESLNNMLGYIIAQDPSPTMIVYPTEVLAEFTSQNRIQPMIDFCPVLKEKFFENKSKLLELQFDGMYVAFSGANSQSSLASKPVRYLLMDEVDKFPANTGKEADPRALAKERQNTFNTNKKTYQASTPTFAHAPIWKEWLTADDQRKYFVPCPHCGQYQVFEFKQIKCSAAAKTNDEAKATAYYECIECGGMIHDSHKPNMLRLGQWRSIKKTGTTKTAFHLNAIYSPWQRFGDVLYKFLISEKDPELFQNFVNSWLAQPWEQTEVKMNTDIVLERQSEYEEWEVPPDTILITGGVDVQKDKFYWTIRAWGEKVTSWNIAHGVASSYGELEEIMDRSMFDCNGHEHIVNLCAIDSGFNTDDVYQFCYMNSRLFVPAKGSSSPLPDKFKETKIDKENSVVDGMMLFLVDGAYFKDAISNRLLKPNGSGSWMVYKGCDREYADQICSEEKVKEKKKNGQHIMVWRKKERVENHWLDAEVYAMMAAYRMGVHLPKDKEQPKERQPEPAQRPQESSYINTQKDWIPRKEGWIR